MPLGYSPLSSQNMEEKDNEKYNQAGQIFENFVQASTCKGTIQAFNILTRYLELDPLDNRNFYPKLKSKVTSWKAKALWNKLDKRASHKEYKRGKACVNTKCLIVGGGPCGLRTAIELAFLGAKVVVVEKRDTFSRNNVLHLWPFTIHDLRSLGAKKFYGKFCAGSIDHISIRQLQLILFKIALMLGVEIHVNLEFTKVIEPPEDQENQKIGWRAEFLPMDHPLSEYEFDVIIGADGRRNTLEGFRRKEFRGKLAIAITANFINRNTTAEAKVEEISGVAFIFNQKFFQDLKEETGIDLENIVYYKDSTHYFVMTAKKQSLLEKGVIINDYIDTEMLLCAENVDQDNLLSYAREAADFATDYQLPALDFAINHYGQPDVAMFDFTSMYASENAALVRERHRHQLLVALVGDSLVEPFWPMGTGCARGFLAAFDTAWMVKSWALGKHPFDILAERESIYRLLPQTTPENITKNFDLYTIDPATRYPNLNSSCVRPHQVKHLYITNELQSCPLERSTSIRRSIGISRQESDVRPNKLLTWCQKQTEGYRNVNITDLTSSWSSGLALCAIIHHFRPDLIDFDSLNEEDAVRNNQLAFDIAEREFGIPPITTGKEMVSAGEPDKLSMVMYLSKFYELFRGTPLRAVGTVGKQNGERNDICSTKSTNFIFNNYINLTFPRKRVPKAEENETNKRRRKSLINFEESSSSLNHGTNSNNQLADVKEALNGNKVKSMATQLLAKFEENAPSVSIRRQELVDQPALHLSPESPINPRFAKPKEPINPRFAKPKEPTCNPPPPSKSQFQATARPDRVVRDPMQSLPAARPMSCVEQSELNSSLSETLASSCPAAFALSGVLQRLQHVEEKINQKRAQSIANREFHKKSIKEKAAHLASMFGCVDIPKNKLPTKGLSYSQHLSPSCLSSHGSAASSSSIDYSASPAIHSKKMTVGKVSRGIGAVAQVLVNLYMNDHRPSPLSTSLELGSLRKEFPQSIGGSDVCCFCKKRVYVMERLSAEGHFFHRECFKCAICATTLRLAMYAFDAEEDKFYCKLHFAQCKTKNTHRKRRTMLKSHEKYHRTLHKSVDEFLQQAGSLLTKTVSLNEPHMQRDELWKQEEPMSSETTSECAFAASSSSEDRSPDCYTCSMDEPVFPKKSGNVPGFDLKGRHPSVSSEWALVRVTPEEKRTEHNLSAVRVTVNSDGSSSELEPDFYGDSSTSGFNEGLLPAPRRPLLTNTDLMKEKEGPGKSKAAHALQRAYSLRDSSTSKKYQNWKKKIQSTFPLLHGKKNGSSSKDLSIIFQNNDQDDLVDMELTSPSKIPETAKGHFKPHDPAFPIKKDATDNFGEIPFYVPHYSLYNCTEGYSLAQSKSFSQVDQTSTPSLSPKLGVKDQSSGNQTVNTEQLTSGLFTKNWDTSSVNPDEGDKTSQSGNEQQDKHLNKAKNKIMRRLTLSMEHQAKLFASNDAGTSIQQHIEGIPDEKNIDLHRDENISTQSSYGTSPKLSGNHVPAFPLENRLPKNVDHSSKEHMSTEPKSPLRLLANAIKKSILEPRISSPESLKKDQDTHGKVPSENTFFNFPHPLCDSVSLRNGKNQGDPDVSEPELSVLNPEGKGFGIGSSKVSDGPCTPTEAYSCGASPVYSTQTNPLKSPHKNKPLSYSNVEDVPTLLERFTLKENLWTSAKDDWNAHNQKNTMCPSVKQRSKSAAAFSDNPVQRNNMWNLFSNFRNKLEERVKAPSSMTAVSPCAIFDVDEVLNHTSKGEEGPKYPPSRKQMPNYTSSSSDGELEHKSSLSRKTKRSRRKNRKLEKETKQLVKQEELKRLHKAQAIQRLLEEVDEKQRALEIHGVKIEKELRGETDSSTQDETQLLHEWFELVLEKNKLMCYESELLLMAKELELEDHQN
ncbi:F-actin-monooxygenase MICAL2 isoform X2 [Anolis sagrei]|uniref:F-actin-monooxygenase MICAL2 isoform X2 n=1 Tax=Anolis sagrei TaxID=38937 RepID=UPI00352051FA